MADNAVKGLELEENDLKYLFFSIDGEEFGLKLSLVQEIISMQKAAPVPGAKAFCLGVINIRGTVVPVIDMRSKLGKPPCDYTDTACIIVLELEGQRVGAVVERVLDVLEFTPEQILDTPARTEGTDICTLTEKLTETNGRVQQLLDMRQVLGLGQS